MHLQKSNIKSNTIVIRGMYMKKPYTFRLNSNLIKELDSLNGNRTYNLESAIQMYVQKQYDCTYNSTTETIHVLKETITDLRQDKQLLQNRIDYLMLPWYKRLLLPTKRT